MNFVNHSGKEIQTMVFLNKEDVINYQLGYDEIQERNILEKSLLPKENYVIESKDIKVPYCIYYEDTEYQSYFNYQPQGETVNLSAGDLLMYPTINPMADTLSTIEIKIDNQSDYYIRYIVIEADGYPDTYYAMNHWNIVDDKQKQTIVYDAFDKGDPILSISLIGFNEGRKKETKYTKDLDDYLIFTN